MRIITTSVILFCMGIILCQSAQADTLAFLTDRQTRSVWRDAKAGTISNDFTYAFEGTRSLKFLYSMARDSGDTSHPNGWAGFGFWLYAPIDITPYSYLTMAIQGPTSANAQLWIAILTKSSADTADTGWYYSTYKVPEQPSATQWVIVNAPLDSFDTTINKALCWQVDFHIESKSGISTDTGTFYLDNVVFRSEPASQVIGFGGRDAGDFAWGTMAGSRDAIMQVFTLNGICVYKNRHAINRINWLDNECVSSFSQALPNGSYIVKISDPFVRTKRLLINR